MRKLSQPFCAVCQRVIRETLAPYDPRTASDARPTPREQG